MNTEQLAAKAADIDWASVELVEAHPIRIPGEPGPTLGFALALGRVVERAARAVTRSSTW